jgi:CDGSH-type Zn-finger protein
VAECGQAKGELFVAGRKPWCDPDVTTPEQVREVCERCPSGALTYTDKSGASEQPPGHNTAMISSNGPLYLRGDLEIEGTPPDMPGLRFRAALCRCGASRNKPFCDGSHESTGFKDYGAVGDRGNGSGVRGGRLAVKVLENGPLLVSGNFTLLAGSGREAWSGNNAALCRCGASRNKPFCDGSHNAIGFQAKAGVTP